MSEKPTYNPTIWKNEGEGGDVPDLSAENLNNIEQGIYKIYEYAINQLINSDDFIAKLSDRIVNSGSISDPGYAADARQLNPSQEGSLAQTVTQLKNDLGGIKLYFYEEILQIIVYKNSEPYRYIQIHTDIRDTVMELFDSGWSPIWSIKRSS